MGVVYKLTPEVIEYIVHTKKSTPKISVRKLAEHVSEKFKCPVSKSSVNTVLKNAHLSSSVGRRKDGAGKKNPFKIPEIRKKQLFGGLDKKELIPEPASPLPKDIVKTPVSKNDPGKTISPEKRPEQTETTQKGTSQPQWQRVDIKKSPVRTLNAFQEEFSRRRESERLTFEEIDHAGLVFFAAALDYFQAGNDLPEILSRWRCPAIPQPMELAVLEAAYKILVSDQFWEDPGQFDRSAVKPLLGGTVLSTEKPGGGVQWLQSRENLKHIVQEAESALADLSALAVKLKIQFENGDQLLADPFLTRATELGSEDYSVGLKKAIRVLSERVISNVKPILLEGSREAGLLESGQGDLIRRLVLPEGNAMTSMALTDEDGRMLVEFKAVPNMARRFIAPLRPDQEELQQAQKALKYAQRHLFYDKVQDKGWIYAETRADVFKKHFQMDQSGARIIAVWSLDDDRVLGGLLTNDLSALADKVFSEYLERFPGWPKTTHLSGEFFPDASNAPPRHEEKSLDELQQYELVDVIEKWAKVVAGKFACLFGGLSENDINICNKKAYKLKGQICQSKDALVVRLTVPEGEEGFQKWLSRISMYINALGVVCGQRRVWILTD